MKTAERVIEVLVRVADSPIVREQPDLALFERGVLDSLATVELLVALSTEFDVELSPAELDREEWATPSRIVRYMEQRVGA
jgi:D-alanine--poly(phosphoribitol) ligase subunit 2